MTAETPPPPAAPGAGRGRAPAGRFGLPPRYAVRRPLGRGAMGEVILAHDRDLDRLVAVKVLLRRTDSFDGNVRARFDREARVVMSLTHEALVPLLDAALDGEPPYLVMPFLSGGDLGAEILRGPGEPARVSGVGARLARALGYLHREGVLHRDVKPSNVLLDAGGEPFLADLGLVTLRDGEGLTGTGLIVGTPRYMAPEIFLEGTYSPASDTFALGVTLVELATGTWVQGSPGRPDAAGEVARGLPEGSLRSLLLRMVRQVPGSRPADLVAVATDLEALAASPSSPAPPGEAGSPRPSQAAATEVLAPQDPGSIPEARPLGPAGGGGWRALLVLAALLLGLLSPRLRPDPPRVPDAAETPRPRPWAAVERLLDRLDTLVRVLDHSKDAAGRGVGDGARPWREHFQENRRWIQGDAVRDNWSRALADLGALLVAQDEARRAGIRELHPDPGRPERTVPRLLVALVHQCEDLRTAAYQLGALGLPRGTEPAGSTLGTLTDQHRDLMDDVGLVVEQLRGLGPGRSTDCLLIEAQLVGASRPVDPRPTLVELAARLDRLEGRELERARSWCVELLDHVRRRSLLACPELLALSRQLVRRFGERLPADPGPGALHPLVMGFAELERDLLRDCGEAVSLGGATAEPAWLEALERAYAASPPAPPGGRAPVDAVDADVLRSLLAEIGRHDAPCPAPVRVRLEALAAGLEARVAAAQASPGDGSSGTTRPRPPSTSTR